MTFGEWMAVGTFLMALFGTGGVFGWFAWFTRSQADRRKEIDLSFARMDECLHRVEKDVMATNAEVLRHLGDSERRTSMALAAFQAQVASRSEMESRISKDIAAAVQPLHDDIRRIDRRLDNR